MNQVLRTLLPTALLFPLLGMGSVHADDDVPRADRHYVGLMATTLHHRTIGEGTKKDAWSSAGTIILGGHITDLFHAELRAGGGTSEASIGDLSLGVDYFASWYIGMHYPLSDYANVYGQFGFSYISGESTLDNPEADENRQFADIVGDYPDSTFSVSWVAGLDYEVIDKTYIVLEGGRLFKDTGTDINTFQFSAGLRYEF